MVEATLNRTHWNAFFAAWGGWLLDGFTASIYAFVALPAAKYLLPASGISSSLTVFFIGIFLATFLIGWGTAFIFGPMGDRFGRFKILALSIVLYAIGSFLSGIATNAYEFAFFRFITGLGIGAEWFIGGTSVAEVFPENKRVMGSGLFHSGYYFGFLAAALADLGLYSFIGWRGELMLGILPVVFIIYVRMRTKEPEKWKQSRNKLGNSFNALSSFKMIFSKNYARQTIVASLVMTAVILGLWSGTIYVPTAIGKMVTNAGHLGAYAGVELAIFTIIGCLIMPVLAEKIGRRLTLTLFLVLMAIGVFMIYNFIFYTKSITELFLALPILGIGGADFAVFSLWTPELYPTEARSSGFGAVTTFGRYFAAAFTFLVGLITVPLGFGHGVAVTAVAFIIVIPLVFLMRETNKKGLREEVLKEGAVEA